MQRLPPAGWSRHHLVYPHRCIYCSPNLNTSEYTRQVSQLSSPPLPMPEPLHFPDFRNNSTKNLKNFYTNDISYDNRVSVYSINDSINDSIRAVSPFSDRESISISINDQNSDKEIKLRRKKSPMDNPPLWRRIYWGFLVFLNIYTLIGSIILIVTYCIRANPFKVNISPTPNFNLAKNIKCLIVPFSSFSPIKMPFQITCSL
jgi:hypothetical protein